MKTESTHPRDYGEERGLQLERDSKTGGDGPLLVVLHGVNLNLLGERPSVHYGSLDLPALERHIGEAAASRGWRCLCYQTNHEGRFVELVHQYRREADALLVNPGAWTHYSYAIRDALEVVSCPVAEVHLSDITRREPWRRYSVLEGIAQVRVWGKGAGGYDEAMDSLAPLLDKP